MTVVRVESGVHVSKITEPNSLSPNLPDETWILFNQVLNIYYRWISFFPDSISNFVSGPVIVLHNMGTIEGFIGH